MLVTVRIFVVFLSLRSVVIAYSLSNALSKVLALIGKFCFRRVHRLLFSLSIQVLIDLTVDPLVSEVGVEFFYHSSESDHSIVVVYHHKYLFLQ